ncbi:MAG: TIGR03943 family protein [Synergistaceae bacterium]|jgi:putative membrane protein|nr:TIGR03943 family protein [Synergistaceae bacterium]
MIIQSRAFNSQRFLEASCCLSFAALTLYLVESGRYLAYVTPRMKLYLLFSAAVMIIWACAGLSRLFVPQNRTRSAHCFVLAVPILLLLLPHNPLSTSDLSYNFARGNTFGSAYSGRASGSGGAETLYGADEIDPEADFLFEDDGDYAADAPEFTPDQMYENPSRAGNADLSGMDESAKKITVENDDFYTWLEEIFLNPDRYEGYTIRMTGFVFKDPEMLLPDEFAPVRLVMSCCVADLLPFGMICKYDKVDELQADSWVTVEGVIHITEENGYREPQARVTGVTPAAEVEGYIYPSY